jgi:hypothetical protein
MCVFGIPVLIPVRRFHKLKTPGIVSRNCDTLRVGRTTNNVLYDW